MILVFLILIVSGVSFYLRKKGHPGYALAILLPAIGATGFAMMILYSGQSEQDLAANSDKVVQISFYLAAYLILVGISALRKKKKKNSSQSGADRRVSP